MSNPDNYFKPGKSGNPKGRPKAEWTWSGLLKETLEELDEATGQEKKYAIVKALYKQAVKGNIQAIKEYGDRIDGRAKQSIELEADIKVTEYEKLTDDQIDEKFNEISENRVS